MALQAGQTLTFPRKKTFNCHLLELGVKPLLHSDPTENRLWQVTTCPKLLLISWPGE